MENQKFERAKEIKFKIDRIQQIILQFEHKAESWEKDVLIPAATNYGTRNSSGIYISELGSWIEEDNELLKNHSKNFFDLIINTLKNRIKELEREFSKL